MKSILDFFRSSNDNSAKKAKERLQIVVAHERTDANTTFISDLKQDLIKVISKYMQVNNEQVKVSLQKNDSCSVLELNVQLATDK